MKITVPLLFGLLMFLVACKNDQNPAQESKISNKTAPIIKQEVKMETRLKNLDTDYCMGRFEPKSHADFKLIPAKYADRKGLYLRKEVLTSFVDMYEAAKKDGIHLKIRSATRNFNYQKGIWERKWTGATTLSDGTNVAKDIKEPLEKALKILEYSSMPGTSRHHWGTDIDLNAFNNSYFEKGEGKKIYDWLTKNADSYGFCQPYTPKGKDRPYGYNEEKWHWTYNPLGSEITAFAKQNLKNSMITGFKGAETAEDIDVVNKYVLGINNRCMH